MDAYVGTRVCIYPAEEFLDAMSQFIDALKKITPDVRVKQLSSRIALTKCSFRLGCPVVLSRLQFASDFAEICTRKEKVPPIALPWSEAVEGIPLVQGCRRNSVGQRLVSCLPSPESSVLVLGQHSSVPLLCACYAS